MDLKYYVIVTHSVRNTAKISRKLKFCTQADNNAKGDTTTFLP